MSVPVCALLLRTLCLTSFAFVFVVAMSTHSCLSGAGDRAPSRPHTSPPPFSLHHHHHHHHRASACIFPLLPLQVCIADIQLSRVLEHNKHVLWASPTSVPDLGGAEGDVSSEGALAALYQPRPKFDWASGFTSKGADATPSDAGGALARTACAQGRGLQCVRRVRLQPALCA